MGTEANFNNWLAWLSNIRYPSLTPAEEGTSYTSAPVVTEWNPCNCPGGDWSHEGYDQYGYDQFRWNCHCPDCQDMQTSGTDCSGWNVNWEAARWEDNPTFTGHI